MRTFQVIMAVVTSLMAVFTLICGLWMKAQAKVDPSSVQFHIMIGIITVVCIIITAITIFIRK